MAPRLRFLNQLIMSNSHFRFFFYLPASSTHFHPLIYCRPSHVYLLRSFSREIINWVSLLSKNWQSEAVGVPSATFWGLRPSRKLPEQVHIKSTRWKQLYGRKNQLCRSFLLFGHLERWHLCSVSAPLIFNRTTRSWRLMTSPYLR